MIKNINGLLISFTFFFFSGCAGFSTWIASSGPNAERINGIRNETNTSGIQIVDVDSKVARKLIVSGKEQQFSNVFVQKTNGEYKIGAGDYLEIAVWEAPPATLFGNAELNSISGSSASNVSTFPEQMVDSQGYITVPFAGRIKAADKTLHQIETDITKKLTGKANQPQVIAHLSKNMTSNVTVVGEVGQSVRMPLSARGERLLDALAAAGGARQPIDKTTLQVTRGAEVHTMALDTIIRDPKQNIVLQPGDVITALFQPLSFTVLGATGKNGEVNFEAQGITLAQALARSGGLRDERADAEGVFIFRFEDPAAVDKTTNMAMTPEGKVPVVYRVDLKNPATFFAAQEFPIKNKDILYVSNAPAAELQKFLTILTSVVYTIATPINLGIVNNQ